MDSYGWIMIGDFKVESVTTLPSFVSEYADKRRIIYTEDTEKIYIGLVSGWQEIQFTEHASDHITSGSDEIDGDKLDIDFTPSNYTPDATISEVDDVNDLSAHLRGVDIGINTLTSSTHASRHINISEDEIDGDKLDIDFTPSNYTPDATISEVDDVNDLSAHLKGIDTALGTTVSTHAASHKTAGSDEIDGDKIDITYSPTNYTPTISPTGADNIVDITAHLAGIDNTIESGEKIKAWVNFYYNTKLGPIIRDSYNINSITRLGTGQYQINWDTDFANNSYCVVGNAANSDTAGSMIVSFDVGSSYNSNFDISYVKIETRNDNDNQNEDSERFCTIMAIG